MSRLHGLAVAQRLAAGTTVHAARAVAQAVEEGPAQVQAGGHRPPPGVWPKARLPGGKRAALGPAVGATLKRQEGKPLVDEPQEPAMPTPNKPPMGYRSSERTRTLTKAQATQLLEELKLLGHGSLCTIPYTCYTLSIHLCHSYVCVYSIS